MARTYVLDTNVLIADPDAPGRFQEHDIAIPLTVVEELDKLKTRPDETGASARRAIRTLERLRQQGNLSEGVELPGGGRIWVEVALASRLDLPEALSSDSSDNRILATTANLAKELAGEREVVLVSKDASLRIKAEALKLLAEEYRHERVAIEEGYLGVAICEQATGIDAIYAARGGEITTDQPLWANQFVVLRSGSQSALGQVRRTVEAGEPVEVTLVGEPPETFGVRGRSKEQQFALHLLHDPNVQLEPLTFIRGRTFARTFAILDEAQNVEYGVLRSLASRLGEGSKLVLCHDTSQVDHPYVDPDSGVAAMIERLKGEPLFGHVTLVKGERSPVAELVARKL